MTAAAAAEFAPWSPAFVAEPYPAYAGLRERGDRTVWFEPTGQWLVPHHEDVTRLLRDRRLGRTYLHHFSHEEFGQPAPPPGHREFHALNDSGLLELEPPDHTRIRRLVSKAFTPRTVARLRPTVERLAAALVEELCEAGGGDLITRIAEPLPVAVIAEMLGVPLADRGLLRPWSAAIVAMFEMTPGKEPDPETAVRAERAAAEFSAYLRGLIAERRAVPSDDLISALIAVQEDDGGGGADGGHGGRGSGGRRLTEQEMVSTCALLLNAGHEAGVNATGNGWLALFRDPEQLARLRAEPEALLPTAVEELLRYDTPLQMFERWVLEDIEIGGTVVPRGSEVALLLGSANRDPARFPHPDRLDLARSDNPHVSFGAGIHYCLGAPLARLELAALFGALLRRAPGLRLAAEPSWRPGYVIRGLRELRVEL